MDEFELRKDEEEDMDSSLLDDESFWEGDTDLPLEEIEEDEEDEEPY